MRRIKKLLYLVFGEWNGLQNIIASSVFIFLFDHVSLGKWIFASLTHQREYLPVFFYLLAVQFIIFLSIKAAVQWKHYTAKKPAQNKAILGRDLLQPLIILIHKWLLGFLVTIIFVYVFKNIYVYLYKSGLPLITTYLIIIKLGLLISLIYIFALLQFSIPLIYKGRSFKKVQTYFHGYVNKHWKKVLPLYLVQILWIYASILLFKFCIDQIAILNGLDTMKIISRPLLIKFSEVNSLSQYVANTLILSLGFLLSNLLYCPFIFLTKKGFNYFHFLITPLSDYATEKEKHL